MGGINNPPASVVSAFAAPGFTLGTANVEGAASTAVRSDATLLAFDATVPVTQAHSDAGAAGVATVPSRRDHRHGMPAAGGGLANVVEDLTPQLGGDLAANSFDLTGIGHVGFLATQDASAGANDLDDYEEGSWTPTLQDSSFSDAEGQAYVSQLGQYTKIGRLVTFSAFLHLSSIGTLTAGDPAYLAGLPFTVSSQDGSAIVGGGVQLAVLAGTNVTGVIEGTFTRIALQLWDAAAGVTALLVSEVSADGIFRIAGHYEV